MDAPLIQSVEFKNPGTTKLVVHGIVVTKATLTPELYMKLVKLKQSYANHFTVKFKEEPKEETNENE